MIFWSSTYKSNIINSRSGTIWLPRQYLLWSFSRFLFVISYIYSDYFNLWFFCILSPYFLLPAHKSQFFLKEIYLLNCRRRQVLNHVYVPSLYWVSGLCTTIMINVLATFPVPRANWYLNCEWSFIFNKNHLRNNSKFSIISHIRNSYLCFRTFF